MARSSWLFVLALYAFACAAVAEEEAPNPGGGGGVAGGGGGGGASPVPASAPRAFSVALGNGIVFSWVFAGGSLNMSASWTQPLSQSVRWFGVGVSAAGPVMSPSDGFVVEPFSESTVPSDVLAAGQTRRYLLSGYAFLQRRGARL